MSGIRALLFATSSLFALTVLSHAQAPASGVTPTATCTIEAIADCIETSPAAARTALENRLATGSDAYASKLLGDLHAEGGAFPDATKAQKLYRDAYEGSDAYAGQALANILKNGTADERSEAIDIFEDIATSEPTTAQYALYDAGQLREERAGDGDAEQASENYEAALAAGNPWAAVSLAWMVVQDQPSPLSTTDLVTTLDREIASGDAAYQLSARQALASLLLTEGPARDFERATEVLSQIAETEGEAGEAAAITLATLRIGSEGGADREASVETLRTAAAAGNADAQFALGQHLLQTGDATDLDEGVELLSTASEAEKDRAAYGWSLVGDALRQRAAAGDLEAARGAYVKAAEAGSGWSAMWLTQMSAPISGQNGNWQTARSYADEAARSSEPRAGVAAYLSLYGTPVEPTSEELLAVVRSAIADETTATVAETAASSSENARVWLAQSIWRNSDLTTSPADGIFGPATASVHGRECAKASLSACKTIVLPKDFVNSILTTLSTRT